MVPSTYKHCVLNLPWAEPSHKKTHSYGPNHIKTLQFKPPLSKYLLYSCKETLSYGPIYIQTLHFKPPLSEYLLYSCKETLSYGPNHRYNKHFFLNLPEMGTSLIKVPDTFSVPRESAYKRFNYM